MWSSLVVIHAPLFTHTPGFCKTDEPVLTQTFIAELPVKTFNVGVLHRLAWINETQGNAALGRPLIHGFAGELWPVIDNDMQRLSTYGREPFQHSHHARTRQRGVDFNSQALARLIIDNIQRAEDPPVGQGVAHEVHRVSLISFRRQ